MAPSSNDPPFFTGIAVSNWSGNRRYRVYVLRGELVFVYAGSAGDVERAVGEAFGAIGAVIAGAAMSKQQKSQDERLEGLDVQQLVAAHKHNFRAAPVHLSECSIDPFSYWIAALYSRPDYAGILRFTHSEKGKIILCIESVGDMKMAIEKVPHSLGSQVAINVEWNPKKKAYRAKK